MNKVELTGRLVADPEVRTGSQSAVARFRIAVNRRFKREGEPDADFISCVAFGKSAEFIEKYFRKGMKIEIVGRIQTGSYEKDGQRIYTTDVVVEEQDFGESKSNSSEASSEASSQSNNNSSPMDGFMNIPQGIEEDLPFAAPY